MQACLMFKKIFLNRKIPINSSQSDSQLMPYQYALVMRYGIDHVFTLFWLVCLSDCLYYIMTVSKAVSLEKTLLLSTD